MYKRSIEDDIKKHFFQKKVIVLYGPRQVGKTTLVKKLYDEYDGEKVFFQCDIPSVRESLFVKSPEELKSYFRSAKLVILDEAQTVHEIGLMLKIFIDTYPDVQIIATGSSSFDLANKIREPLTGRAIEYMLYPLSVEEIVVSDNLLMYKRKESLYFRYGLYPGILDLSETEAENRLGTLQNNTFYKDIFTLDNIRKPKVLQDLIFFLAFNVGSVITSNNLANELRTTSKTIDRYIDILEKMFVIVRLYGYSNNKSNEIKKGYKIYFIDVGMRNSIIKSFNKIEERLDTGAIFENYFIIERIKYIKYKNINSNLYFWQGDRGLEVDLIEERNGRLYAFECKYKDRNSKGLKVFSSNYDNSEANIVTKDNYLDFVL